MDTSAAERLLLSHGDPRQAWVGHSRQVGRVARLLRSHLPDGPAEELVESAGLLHDIGRSRTHGVWHPWEGWRILTDLGHRELARPALTHWLKGRTRRRVAATAPDLDRGRVDRIFAELAAQPMNLLDLLVSVADGFVAHRQVVPMGERYGDLRQRYYDSRWLRDSERITRGQLGRLSEQAGTDLERVVLQAFR